MKVYIWQNATPLASFYNLAASNHPAIRPFRSCPGRRRRRRGDDAACGHGHGAAVVELAAVVGHAEERATWPRDLQTSVCSDLKKDTNYWGYLWDTVIFNHKYIVMIVMIHMYNSHMCYK